MESPPNTPANELQRRLVFSLLRPAVRLGRVFHLPLRTLEDLCRLAYFEELRRGGKTSHAEVARLTGMSLRTVGGLERQYRSDFLAPEHEVELERRVEETLAHGPLAQDEVAAVLTDAEPDEIGRVLNGLAAVGRVRLMPDATPPRYALERSFVSLVRGDLQARVDGLNHQLDVIAQAVRARFLGAKKPSTARTLSFVGTPETMAALGEALARTMREQCGEAEDKALREDGYTRYGATFALAPMEEEESP